MPKLIDLTGIRFGRLIVDGISHRNNRKVILWDCTCECGNKIKTYAPLLKSGNTKSCGCLQKEIVSNIKTKHAKSRDPLNKIYRAMKDRCLNKNNERYSSYGGRGITICDRWLGEFGFENFISDMGDRPSPNHSIDRINNDDGYHPENCRWATKVTQSHNTRVRKDNTSGTKGVSFNKSRNKWNARLNYKGKQVLNVFLKSKEDAVNARKNAEAIIAKHEANNEN